MTLRSLAPVLLLSLLLPTGLAAQTPAEIIENFKPDRHVWHLEVTIDRQGSAHEEMRSDDGGVTRSSNREVNDTVTVHACGQAGLWAVSGVQWTFNDRATSKMQSVAASTICPPPPEAMEHGNLTRMKLYPPDVRRPGDTHTHVSDTVKRPYPGQDEEALLQYASAGLMELPGGIAILSVRAQILIEQKSSDLREQVRVCEGDTVKQETRVETCAPGCLVSVQATEPTENGSRTMVEQVPPLPWVSGLGEKITFEKDAGGALSGSKTLGKTEAKKPGDYQETTTATWRLEPADPCEEVRAMMVQDLAWAEAYLDRALQQAAGNSTARMKELVNRRIAEQSGWKPESDKPPPEAEINMFVNEKCEIEGEDDFRMENRNACKPLILTEAVMAHEQRHVEQCSKQREEEPGTSWNAPSPTRYGNNEAGGYLTGVSKALSWYEDNCPGETASIRKRWKAIALEAATRQLH